MPSSFSINTMPSARLSLLKIFSVLALLVNTSCAAPPPSARIWGGEDALTGAFPFAVSVRLDGAHICGGSIISSEDILTAAHCVAAEDSKAISEQRLSVRVGSTNQFAGGKIVYVAKITVNPNYVSNGYKNDVAVIKLKTPLEWTDKIKSTPYAGSTAEEPPTNAVVTVAGWGEISTGDTSYKLQHTTFTVANAETCKNAFSGSDDSTICLSHAAKEGSCYGDAGNGAVYNNKLVAISSFVVGACGSRYPDVFTNVAFYADWIKTVL